MFISLLGNPSLVIKKITIEEVLSPERIEYNPYEAKRKVDMLKRFSPDVQFFIDAESTLYTLGSIEGFFLFKKFHLFHATLHNGGFNQVSGIIDVEDGESLVYIVGFNQEGKFVTAKNCRENRLLFAKRNLTVTDLPR
jgi:hypothetical protein